MLEVINWLFLCRIQVFLLSYNSANQTTGTYGCLLIWHTRVFSWLPGLYSLSKRATSPSATSTTPTSSPCACTRSWYSPWQLCPSASHWRARLRFTTPWQDFSFSSVFHSYSLWSSFPRSHIYIHKIYALLFSPTFKWFLKKMILFHLWPVLQKLVVTSAENSKK